MNSGLPSFLAGGFLAGLLLAGAPAARAEIIVIGHDDCARLVPHEPAADVAYQPGVDVHGKAVAPADLPGSVQVDLPEIYVFDLVIRPLDDEEFEETGLNLGRVRVPPDGRASFNGKPLQSESQAELSRRCQERLRKAADPQ